MTARLYANENFHQGVVEILRRHGHDVLTTREAGRDNRRIPDEAVMAFAISEGRAVVTFNRLHFLRLHRNLDGAHAGILVCSMDPDLEALAARIDRAIRENEDLQGKVLRINRPPI